MTAPARTALPLPPALAAALDAALDADGAAWVRHPATGAEFHIIRDADAAAENDAADDDRPLTPAERDELDGGQTDMEAILEGVADADAGRFVTDAEIDAAMKAKFPFLRSS